MGVYKKRAWKTYAIWEVERRKSNAKSIADEAEIGIHPSYSSNKNLHELEIEIKRLGKVIKRDITKSRNHFLKLSFPTTYERLLEHDITDDYTMGYANAVGFRAGTSVSFPFYNIDLEQETKLLVHPFAVMLVCLRLCCLFRF
jgi:hypothetical protein